LKEKVYFLPFRKDAVQLMADFDILLLTSDSEGMPLVVLEAQSIGVPVVSTDVGCVGEIVENTVANGTAESLYSEVFKVLTNRLHQVQYSMKTTDIRHFIDEYVSKCYLGITKGVNHK
jgi:glycosyltransferase involved in cell wall biosynthesis